MKFQSKVTFLVLSSILLSAPAFSEELTDSRHDENQAPPSGQAVQSEIAVGEVAGTYHIARSLPAAAARLGDSSVFFSEPIDRQLYLRRMGRVNELKGMSNGAKLSRLKSYAIGDKSDLQEVALYKKELATKNAAKEMEALAIKANSKLYFYHSKVVPALTALSFVDAARRLKNAWIDREPAGLIASNEVANQTIKATKSTSSAAQDSHTNELADPAAALK